MHQFEIEIKSLLGSKEKVDALVSRMKQKDPNLKILGSHKQLNHYFVGGSLKSLYDKVGAGRDRPLLDETARAKLKNLAERAKNFSVRTRDADGKIILVVKATVDDTTSENGTARLEWESTIFPSPSVIPASPSVIPASPSVIPAKAGIHSINDLDNLVLSAGFSCQAKWSRERQEFVFSPPTPYPHFSPLSISIDKNAEKLSNNIPLSRFAGEGAPSDERGAGEGKPATITVSIDKNAGYGYLAEFEMVIGDESKADQTKSFIRNLMHQLGATELPQDRLERMFKFYNDHWKDYYGTEKIFIIE